MKSCEDVLDLLPDALPWIRGEALDVHEHLKLCTSCADTVESLAGTVDVLKTQAPAPPEPAADFADRVLAALPPEPRGELIPMPKASGPRLGLRIAAAAVLFAAGVLTARALEDDTPPTPLAAVPSDVQPSPRVVPTPAPVDEAPSQGLQPIETAPVDLASADMGRSVDPLAHYVSEASLVLQAVETLDSADPNTLRLLAYHVRRTELLDEGDRLLTAISTADPDQAERLRPLISGTQLILRKVRHARGESSPHTLWTIRQEVRETGILDAYRQLLAARRASSIYDEPL